MSKQIIKFTNKGIVESISGNSQEIPSSVEVQVGESSFVKATKFVGLEDPNNLTGSFSSGITFSSWGTFLILPENPVSGQQVELIIPQYPDFLNPSSVSITGSYSITNYPSLGGGPFKLYPTGDNDLQLTNNYRAMFTFYRYQIESKGLIFPVQGWYANISSNLTFFDANPPDEFPEFGEVDSGDNVVIINQGD